MRSTSIAVSLLLIAAAAPAIAIPVPSEGEFASFEARSFDESYDIQARDLEARFKLPTGLLAKLKGPLFKELGSGLLTGGAFAGLAGLLGGGSDTPAAAPAPARRSFEVEARDLEARFKLPTGLLTALKGPLVKELGSGLLTGGAFAGLAGLLGGGSDTPAPARRDLSHEEIYELHRRGFGALLTKLVGAEGKIGDIIKNGIFGGLASGAVIGGANAAQSKREEELTDEEATALMSFLSTHEKRSIATSLAKLFKGGAGTAIKGGLVNGLGSAVGGLGIGALIDKFTGGSDAPAAKREVPELDEDDLKVLIALMPPQSKRSLASSLAGLFKGGAGTAIKGGLVNGLGSAVGGLGIGALISKLTGGGDEAAPPARRSIDDLEAREPLNFGAIGKGLLGTGVGLGASTFASSGIEKLKELFSRELMEELEARAELEAREPLSLGAIGKGLLGTGVGLGASTFASEGIEKLKELFGREFAGLDELD